MNVVNVRELKAGASRLINAGKSVLIIKNSKPAAVLIPWSELGQAEGAVQDALRWAAIDALSARIAKDMDAKGINEQEVLDDFAEFRKARRGRQRSIGGSAER